MKKTLKFSLGFISFLALAGLFGCEEVKQTLRISPPKPKTLLLVPLGGVPAGEVEEVRQTLLRYYDLRITVAEPTPLPAHTTNEAVGKVLKTVLPLRYRADSLLRYLNREKRGKHDYVLGLANVDITCTNRYENGQIQFPAWMHADWGIFGLGYLAGKACIVSSFRLRFDMPSLPTLNSRIAKVARHEVGHNFGLNHCKNHCFMSAADLRNALVALDNESDSLCASCKYTLGALVKKNAVTKKNIPSFKKNLPQ